MDENDKQSKETKRMNDNMGENGRIIQENVLLLSSIIIFQIFRLKS